jgi:uncharacterized sulfatase
MIVHIPEKFRHLATRDYRPGGASERMIAFVDLAPTVLSLAGVRPPTHMQGGAVFGEYAAPERPYNFGFRGRMDETYDLMHSVADKRYVYIRNYMPHRIYGQYCNTMFEMPTTQVWKKLSDEGKLNAAQRHFWETKPPEELYDLSADRDEVQNLAASPEHRSILERMRQVNGEHIRRTRDVGFLPEGDLYDRAKESSPYDVGHDDARFPAERVISTADLASSLDPKATPALTKALADPDRAVRYWAVSGLLMRGAECVGRAAPVLRKALQDPAPYVRAVAADALARYGTSDDVPAALSVLAKLVPADKNGMFVSLWALRTLFLMGEKARPVWPEIKDAQVIDQSAPERVQGYPGRVMTKLREMFGRG